MIQSRLVTEYLARLDTEIGDLPHNLAVELRAGIAEELEGLDDRAAAARIARLGTPGQVAAEARAASEAPPQAPTQEAPRNLPLRETRGFAIFALILFGLGSFLVPVIGTVVGAVLVCLSKMWTTKEKLWALLAPVFGIAIAPLVHAFILLPNWNTEENPLVPTLFDSVWSMVLLGGIIVVPIAALWLLVRIIRK